MRITTLRRTTLISLLAFAAAAQAEPEQHHGGEGQPHVQAPHVEQPHVQAPHVEQPHVQAPHVEQPHVQAPHVEQPHVQAPHVEQPHVQAPHVEQPHVQAPHVEQPHVQAPHVGQPHVGQPHVEQPHVQIHQGHMHQPSSAPNPNLHGPAIEQGGVKGHQAPNQPMHPGAPNVIQQTTPAPGHITNHAQPNTINTHAPVRVITNTNPSYLSNRYTQGNLHTSIHQNQQFINAPNNAQFLHQINGYRQQYHNQFYNNNLRRFNVYGRYWQNNYYHDWYSAWYRWGFYGGFWYPVRPYFEIDNYFTYPAVQWFFMDEEVTPEYYTTYYSSSKAPESSGCSGVFPYKHAYFPTDTLRDLLVEVSGFPQDLRCNFRIAVINMTSNLQQAINNYFAASFTFQQNDIVVNYYQNLHNKAIVISGFVNQGNINVAFEALLELHHPDRSITFVPDGQTPTESQLNVLEQMNERIKQLGGDPFTAQQEPATVVDTGNAGPTGP
ncbi:hypothetical protein [Legionella saoudiensis]|uniref:hypothetical protein n=1 Tax=Legionella saoudiensis TaxID=1750561 RepID=UPI000730A9D9|nr:hypothetical protein [Legionella saoudiensis]